MITIFIAASILITQPKVPPAIQDVQRIIQPAPILKPIKLPKIAKVKKLAPVPIPAPKPVVEPPVSSGTTNCGDNQYKQFIYQRESGCNTAAVNPSGCFGIGQDCNGVLRSKCGTDFACQDAYFTNYANSRYGSWAGAWQAWQSQGWW